jgi:ABC-type transport system involved in Fe-S cluster assembly fused permease/ATPase subunit
MNFNTAAEIIGAGLSAILPSAVAVVIALFTKSGAGKSIVRHISFSLWHRRMRKAGLSQKEIRHLMVQAARADLK